MYSLTKTNGELAKGSVGQLARDKNIGLAEAALDAEAVVIIDSSGSMCENDAPGFKDRHAAARSALLDIQAAMPGKVLVVNFSSTVRFEPSGIPEELNQQTMMDAALKFVLPVESFVKVILVSDGRPNDARRTLDVAAKYTTPIDTVFIGPEAGYGSDFLHKLARVTGGQAEASVQPGMLGEPTMRLLTATAGEEEVIAL